MVPAFGANIADDLTFKPTGQIQARVELGASGHDDGGNDYNIYNGTNGSNEAVRFGIRRARFGFEAANTTGWKGTLQIRAGESYDTSNAPVNGSAGLPSATVPSSLPGNRVVELYYANIQKTFKHDDFEHELTFGLLKPFNAESSISSTTYMFPADRVVAKMIETRNVGFNYKLTGMNNLFRVGFAVLNGSGTGYTDSTDTSAAAVGTQTSGETNGPFISGRIEFSPTPDLVIKKKMESYAGAEGTGVVIGFDYQDSIRQFNATPATKETSTLAFGPDLNFHMDAISLTADYRWRRASADSVQSSVTPILDVPAQMYDVVLGYAIPLDAGFVIEPAIRYEQVMLDTDHQGDPPAGTTTAAAAANPYSGGEWTGTTSGKQWSMGVNFYWNGNNNKTQFAYMNYTGISTSNTNYGNAAAHVFVIQHQLSF